MLESLVNQYRVWTNGARRQAMAEAYLPIVRGFLLPGSAYYIFVTWGHWRDESGALLAILGGLSLLTAIAYHLFRTKALAGRATSLGRLEAVGVTTNLLMYANVLLYMNLHFEQEKLVYFVLMAVVFSTTGVTLRSTLASVTLSIATLLWLAHGISPERFQQFAFIGVATSFAAFGMATLLRKAILRQIDARLRADDMALRDSLTGIPNRRSIFGRIERLEREQEPFWLGILDLDGFKSINDIYGHAVGDTLLCAVVDRLQKQLPASMTVGRIGGDEFVILIPGEASAREIELLGNRIIADLSDVYRVQQLQLNISGTIGIAHYPTTGSTGQQIYEKADFSLYRGKENARGQTSVFTVNEDKEMRECLALERGLREADLDRELHLLFQPQMDLRLGRVTGFEALARWKSPTLGAVRPDRFIRAAERAGLIQDVTKILFRKALDAVATWPDDISISFNLSAQDVADRVFLFSLVAEVLSRGIDPARIEFEITETAVMKDVEASRALLSDLSATGFKIALDDFGSGYSSFAYIDQLPLNKVKIDKTFVRRVGQSAAAREIIAGICTLCQNLGLKCVLEGVETDGEMEILMPLRPQIIQGFLFGKPMDNESAQRVLVAQDQSFAGRDAQYNVAPLAG
jgi:diguanylate cyclase (GGDEF)-like protein